MVPQGHPLSARIKRLRESGILDKQRTDVYLVHAVVPGHSNSLRFRV